ncbi:molybdenum cofactor guanylyltransferase [Candidatus Pelagibacter sp.]|jgi:molybdopterin-guanine dinucleotide biosynthesis protein A|nr:molybdenum cofactor guanylyltransferase [Candidatus Pelagibacter sp.]|tara:strand:- start:390 stop:995 length:606 start_codon:yes stop_codon:yes gene_type:complete
MDHSKILGVVLAGGKSLRFGEDKSQVKLNNKSLIDHILSEILTEFKELLIVSNNSIKFNKSEKISIIGDFKNNLGPLGGVLTAMKWIKDNNKDYQWISTFPTDTPFFKNQILKDFHDKINLKNGKLFFIKSNNTRHNIFGLWSIDLADKLEKDLENGDRKVEDWANKVGVNIIDMQFEKNDPFFNINTKEDLEKAKDIFND